MGVYSMEGSKVTGKRALSFDPNGEDDYREKASTNKGTLGSDVDVK